MAKPDFSNVTQEDVEALFDKDGDLREPSLDDEKSEDADQGDEDDQGEEESDAEDQEEEEEESEEESEEEEEPESDEDEEESEDEEETDEAPDLNWEKVKPEYKAAFDEVTSERDKLRKDYGKLHSKYTQAVQAQKDEDGSLEAVKSDAHVARQWNAILEQHPQLSKMIEREIAKLQDPFADVPEYLKEDPLFQQMVAHNKRMEQRLAQLDERVAPVKDWDAQQREAKNRQVIDGLLTEAGTHFKSLFKRDWNEQEKTEVLRYMVQKNFYENGEVPVWAVFKDQYQKQATQKRSTELKAKAKKFGTRTKGVNLNRANRAPKDAETAEDAIAMALAEQGYGT